MTVSAIEKTVRGLHIGGEWTEASGGQTFEDRDPFTDDVVASVPAGTREDARRAIDSGSDETLSAGTLLNPFKLNSVLGAATAVAYFVFTQNFWPNRDTGAVTILSENPFWSICATS